MRVRAEEGGRMKPTDEERREVAEKLRAKLRERDRPGVFVPRGIEPFALLLMEDIAACLPSDDSMFAVLADLIEPEPERTCRNEADALNEREGFETYSFVCSECGYNELKKDADRVLCLRLFDLNYCRMCGSKVVE